MPRGDKTKYTDKQERKADHIAEGYEKRGVPEQEAERRAWATVNKDDGGGRIPGGLAVASLPAIRRPIRVARRVAQPRLRARHQAAPHLERRPRPRVSGMRRRTPEGPAVPRIKGCPVRTRSLVCSFPA